MATTNLLLLLLILLLFGLVAAIVFWFTGSASPVAPVIFELF